MKQIILEFFLQYGEHGSFSGILTVQDFGGAIRPFDSRRFTFDSGTDHLLDRDFSGRFQRHRRRTIETAHITEANELKTVSLGIGPAHELAAGFGRGIDRWRVYRNGFIYFG